jgi:UV excision repair protein RAD23
MTETNIKSNLSGQRERRQSEKARQSRNQLQFPVGVFLFLSVRLCFLEVRAWLMVVLSFRTLSNRNFEVEVDLSEPISRVKQRFADEFGFSGKNLRLIYKGHALSDESTLAQSGVDGSSFVVIYTSSVPPLRPPPPSPPRPVAPPPTPQQSPERSASLTSQPLPRLVCENSHLDPPNFEELVSQLESLGFGRGDCAEALRAALYRSDLAAHFLLEGLPQVERFCVRVDDEEDGEGEDESLVDIRQQLLVVKEGGAAFDDFLTLLRVSYPFYFQLFNRSPIGFLKELGFDPGDFDFVSALQTQTGERPTMYDELMGQFSSSEREAVRRLEAKGFDTMTVIQVYIACDKGESETEACLRSMTCV